MFSEAGLSRTRSIWKTNPQQTSKNDVPWLQNTHICLPRARVCERKKPGRDADFPSGISTFRFPPCLSLYSRPSLFIFPSYPKHGNAPRSSDLACHPDACTHADPREPTGPRLLPLPSSLKLSPPRHLCLSSPFVPGGSSGGRGRGGVNTLCAA